MAGLDVLDPAEIAAFLRRRAALHVYELGDLDEPYFGRSRFFGSRCPDGALEAVALLYDGGGTPTLVALAPEGPARDASRRLLLGLDRDALPDRVYAHLSPRVFDALSGQWRVIARGQHRKYAWTDRAAARGVATEGALRLTAGDAEEVAAFLEEHYPENFFHPRSLESGMAFGIRDRGGLVCFAGVHVHSARMGVAALGNVTTAAAQRGKGHARRACAALLQALDAETETVGLNVEVTNGPALRCYASLGFTPVDDYEEVDMVRVA